MAFRISIETDDELILVPAVGKHKWLRWPVIGLGVLAMLAGGLLASRTDAGPNALLLAGALAFLGLLAAAIGNSLVPYRGNGVVALVFDRRLGAVRVRGEGQPAEACLAYARIARVHLFTKADSSPGTTGPDNFDSTSYTHYVSLHLTDGSTWTLTEETSREVAETQLRRITAAWQAGRDTVQPTPPPDLPGQVKVDAQGSATVLRWNNPVSRREVTRKLLGFSFFGILLAIIAFIFRASGVPVVSYVVAGSGALALVGWGGKQIRQLRRDKRNECSLIFSATEVTYCETEQATGEVTLRESTPLAQWYGLSYAFNAVGGSNDSVLLLSQAAHEQYLAGQQDELPFRERLRLLRADKLARTLVFKQFSPTQRLAVVNWVRAETARRLAPR